MKERVQAAARETLCGRRVLLVEDGHLALAEAFFQLMCDSFCLFGTDPVLKALYRQITQRFNVLMPPVPSAEELCTVYLEPPETALPVEVRAGRDN